MRSATKNKMDKSVFRLWVQRLAGLALVFTAAYGVGVAVRDDCRVDLGIYENCSWMYVRETLGLPQSKVLRWGTLQCMGLGLLSVLWVGVRLLLSKRSSASKVPS